MSAENEHDRTFRLMEAELRVFADTSPADTLFPMTLAQARAALAARSDAEALRARVEALEAALRDSSEYAAELRSYCDGWEWKYGAEWDEYKARIEAALSGEPKGGGA